MRVDLFVDPACMWSWLTSRWLVEVAPERGLEVCWRPYSLLLRAGPEGLENWKAAVWGASLRAVRVLQALDADQPDRVRGFYEAVVSQGVAAYNAGRPPFQDLEGALVAAGLSPAYAAAADDADRDEQVRRSMAEAFAVIGEGVGTPALIVHRDPPVGLLGPVVASTPTGADAVRLWDAVVAFAAVPGVLELSRPRPPRPTVPGLRWQTPQRPPQPAQDPAVSDGMMLQHQRPATAHPGLGAGGVSPASPPMRTISCGDCCPWPCRRLSDLLGPGRW